MELNQILDLVKKDLAKRLKVKKIRDLDTIDVKVAEALLDDEGIIVYNDFKDKLVSPWAVAKYMLLTVEEKDLIERVKQDLENILPNTVDVFFLKKLTCTVQISKKYVNGMKQQSLTLKYFLDEDDKIQYKIVSNNVWGWDISKVQLQALLRNEGFLPENLGDNLNNKKKSFFKRLFKK